MHITLDDIKRSPEIRTYITQADLSLTARSFTEHSFPHVSRCADVAARILTSLHFPQREVELAQIAAYMHDIGNVINRTDHALSGANMAFRILDRMGMPPEEIATVITAIGHHDDSTAFPVNAVAAAVILGDKTDVRRSRVRNQDFATFDIHDRVNYSVRSSKLTVNAENHQVTLMLDVDTAYGSIMDYFEIFLERMVLCRKAAQKLGLDFKLVINGQQLI